jgi:hypothetical protein
MHQRFMHLRHPARSATYYGAGMRRPRLVALPRVWPVTVGSVTVWPVTVGLFTLCFLSACAFGDSAEQSGLGAETTSDSATAIEPEASGLQTVLTALGPDPFVTPSDLNNASTKLPAPLIDLNELRRGGPPPDGIPPIDNPVMIPAQQVDFLADTEPVVAIEVNGEARAYPIQILIWHEIANDTIGGIPVTVTYCPLCNSALAYDRRITRSDASNSQTTSANESNDIVLDFGTSGLLYNSSLVMYDRQTETLWSHFTAQAIHGQLVGTQLVTIPVAMVSWGTWREAHPDSLVLSRETGYERDYGLNPYPGYDTTSGRPFLFQGEIDGRLTAMTRITGIALGGSQSPDAAQQSTQQTTQESTQVRTPAALAVPLVTLQERQVIHTVLADQEILLWWIPGTNSALNLHDIVFSVDVGSVGVFSPIVDGRQLRFRPDGLMFVDEQTESRWNLLGQAVDGPLAGTRLPPIEHLDTFWFAWAAFWPDTVIYR